MAGGPRLRWGRAGGSGVRQLPVQLECLCPGAWRHRLALHKHASHTRACPPPTPHSRSAAIRERGEAWGRHIEDSLALLPVIERHCPGACATSTGGGGGDSVGGRGAGGGGGAFSVIDVGSGAGLPGMVLAIARPQWRVTLLDTLKKRCAFLEAAAARAGARNVSVVWARAEEGGRRADLREGFDLSVARAVADTRVLAELCMPFVRPGGRWVAAKGADPGAEVRAAARAVRLLGGGEALQIVGVDSWAPEGQRTALVVEKAARTPDLYPRPPGSPNKKPL